MARAAEDLTGRRFCRLVVDHLVSRGPKHTVWSCQCDCGTKNFAARGGNLVSENTRSCGCLQREHWKSGSVVHGAASDGKRWPEYRIYHAMISRCTRSEDRAYLSYGGRGITVCVRWMESFMAFIEDMGRRSSKGYSLDRIDNDKGYEPGNCRWATKREQANNRRTNRLIELNGKSQTVAQWAVALGLDVKTVYARLQRGDSAVDALKVG